MKYSHTKHSSVTQQMTPRTPQRKYKIKQADLHRHMNASFRIKFISFIFKCIDLSHPSIYN